MAKELTTHELSTALSCLPVLRAVQQDSRTSRWYRGEVRGKEAIGAATTFLERKGLIHPAVGPQPFRLTKKGKEVITTEIKDWETVVAKLNRPRTLANFAKALGRVSEESKEGQNAIHTVLPLPQPRRLSREPHEELPPAEGAGEQRDQAEKFSRSPCNNAMIRSVSQCGNTREEAEP